MATREYPWRHLVLLISILLVFTVSPAVATLRNGIFFLNLVAATVIIAGVYALSARKRLFAVAIALSAISIITSAFLLLFKEQWALIASHTSDVALAVFFATTILGYVLGTGKVTADRIFAAICVYLLIGYAWTFAYCLLEEIKPGSLAMPIQIDRGDYVARVLQMRYYSFITLATVGYGDIVPRSSAAQTLAVLEAVIGQMYMAVLVARLVGLHIVHASASESRAKD